MASSSSSNQACWSLFPRSGWTKPSGSIEILVGLGLALLFHGGVVLWAERQATAWRAPGKDIASHPTLDVQVDLSPVPPPSVLVEPRLPPPPPVHPPSLRIAAQPVRSKEASSAAASRAGAILSLPSPPTAPPSEGSEAFVSGNSPTFAGGVTYREGRRSMAMYASTASSPPSVLDRSRPAQRLGSSEWDCSWPPEADVAQIDEASVVLRVEVRPTGLPTRVEVLSDPGYGFDQAAKRCALHKKFQPAIDAAGRPIVGTTLPFRVRFER